MYKLVLIAADVMRHDKDIFKLCPSGREYSNSEIRGFRAAPHHPNFVPLFKRSFIDFLQALIIFKRGDRPNYNKEIENE
jgi:hypothetical protein